ncbi:MAG: rhodanese-like domain-containing protein [Sandaracinaceae bacterium]|nr:rhodanese-like domain-containing protein [Sandaracinaceae bacterium]
MGHHQSNPGQSSASSQDPHVLVAQGATLLDVRTPEEYQEKHIEGAILIPVQELEKRIDEIPKDRPVVVYCRSGARAHRAALILQKHGYQVFELGAMSNW